MSSKVELIETVSNLVQKYNPQWDLSLGSLEEIRRGLQVPSAAGAVRAKVSRADFENAIRQMEVDIETVLKKTRRESIFYICILVILFLVAIAIVLRATIAGVDPLLTTGGGIGGLGVTAAWPVTQLRRTNAVRFACRIVPIFVRKLSPDKAEEVLVELIKVIHKNI